MTESTRQGVGDRTRKEAAFPSSLLCYASCTVMTLLPQQDSMSDRVRTQSKPAFQIVGKVPLSNLIGDGQLNFGLPWVTQAGRYFPFNFLLIFPWVEGRSLSLVPCILNTSDPSESPFIPRGGPLGLPAWIGNTLYYLITLLCFHWF